MLKRKIYGDLVEWKNRSEGKTALLIDGARRVGKSYIAKAFAENEYRSHILIDFGNAPEEILDLIRHESYDLDPFFAKLSAFFSTPLYRRESLIVFDEVQQFPRARQLIKYLVADGRYDYLETGSLIRLKKNTEDIIIPSEEEHIEMFPMDFEEFLWALGDEGTVSLLKYENGELKHLKTVLIKDKGGCHQILFHEDLVLVPSLFLDRIMVRSAGRQRERGHRSNGSPSRHQHVQKPHFKFVLKNSSILS